MKICAQKDQPNKFFGGNWSEKECGLALGSLLGSAVRALVERQETNRAQSSIIPDIFKKAHYALPYIIKL
jgi:hypothetical protein